MKTYRFDHLALRTQGAGLSGRDRNFASLRPGRCLATDRRTSSHGADRQGAGVGSRRRHRPVKSALVIEYLESLLPPHHRLVPAAGEARWTTLRWCALAHGMIDATATRVLELRRPEPLQMKERLAHEEARSARIIVAAERGLEGRDYFAGNKLTLADLTLATAMQYIDFRYSHEWRSGAPRLAGWCCTLHDRPSFVSTQPPGFVRPA